MPGDLFIIVQDEMSWLRCEDRVSQGEGGTVVGWIMHYLGDILTGLDK